MGGDTKVHLRIACRIERLEIFDEFEEWHMIQVTGSCYLLWQVESQSAIATSSCFRDFVSAVLYFTLWACLEGLQLTSCCD